MIFVGVYDLKSLPDTLELIYQSLNVISDFETDIRSIGRETPAAISEAHGFVSTKSFVSSQLARWSLIKLLQNVSSFVYDHTNLLSMMTISVEHFHSTNVKNVLMTQLQYTRELMRFIKEALLVTLQVGKVAAIHLQKMILTSEISPPFCHQKLCLHQ